MDANDVVLGIFVVSVAAGGFVLVARRKKTGDVAMKFDVLGVKAEFQDKSTQRRAEITAKGVSVGRDAKLQGAEIDLDNVAVGRDLKAGTGASKGDA